MIFQLIVSGIMLGSVYALLSMGLSLIYGVSKITNFAHGDFVVLGMYTTFSLFATFKLIPYISWILVIPIAALIGAIIFSVVRRTIGQDHVNQILVTLGLSMIIQNLLLLFYKSDFRTIPVIFRKTIAIGNVYFSYENLIAFIISVIITIIFMYVFRKTDIGRSMRAVAQDRPAAALMGIKVGRTDLLVFCLGVVLAGLAGCLLITLFAASPNIGSVYNMLAWVTVVLGGLGQLGGALLAAFLIGITETVSGFYFGADMRQVVYYFVFIITLIFFPNGIIKIATRGRK